MTFFLRTDRDPMSLAAGVTRILHSLEPEAPVTVHTLDDIVAGTIARPRAITVLVGAFALLTLALAAIGVYGVIAYSVRERTQEIGVRLALGATAIAVCRMVLGHALRLAMIGVVAGLIAAVTLTRVLERLLFDVDPLDPWTFVVAPMVLLVVAAIASYIPAVAACTRHPPTCSGRPRAQLRPSLIDLRARGESGGDRADMGPGAAHDVLAATDALRARRLHTDLPLVAYGFSDGARAVLSRWPKRLNGLPQSSPRHLRFR